MGRVITTQAVASAEQFVPARESESSKDPRRSETAQAVASAGSSCLPGSPGRLKTQDVRRVHKLHQRGYEECAPGSHGSSKGSRRAKTAQAASTRVRVVRVRSTRVEQRLEACENCTSCINGGMSSAPQEYTGRVKARGVRRLHKLHQRRYE